jgi:hypothetical protein
MRVSTIHRFKKLGPSEAVLLVNERAGRMVLMRFQHLAEIINKEGHMNFLHQTRDLTLTLVAL